MYNVFNMGIGFVIAAPESEAAKIQKLLSEAGQPSSVIGVITDSDRWFSSEKHRCLCLRIRYES